MSQCQIVIRLPFSQVKVTLLQYYVHIARQLNRLFGCLCRRIENDAKFSQRGMMRYDVALRRVI